MEQRKSNRNFWMVFAVLITFAAISTFGNLFEYGRMEKLNTQGKRVLLPVDSLIQKGSKREIFVTLTVGGNSTVISKKVKAVVAVGDSVPVYYLEQNMTTNGIAVE